MLQTRSDEECSIMQHHLMSETIVWTNLLKNAADGFTYWMYGSGRHSELMTTEAPQVTAAHYGLCVFMCSSSIRMRPSQGNSAFVQNGVIRAEL